MTQSELTLLTLHTHTHRYTLTGLHCRLTSALFDNDYEEKCHTLQTELWGWFSAVHTLVTELQQQAYFAVQFHV